MIWRVSDCVCLAGPATHAERLGGEDDDHRHQAHEEGRHVEDAVGVEQPVPVLVHLEKVGAEVRLPRTWDAT